MPSLDSCINDVYEAGNIGASSGEPPTIISPGSLLDPDTYDPESVTYSHKFQFFYNSGSIQHHRVR